MIVKQWRQLEQKVTEPKEENNKNENHENLEELMVVNVECCNENDNEFSKQNVNSKIFKSKSQPIFKLSVDSMNLVEYQINQNEKGYKTMDEKLYVNKINQDFQNQGVELMEQNEEEEEVGDFRPEPRPQSQKIREQIIEAKYNENKYGDKDYDDELIDRPVEIQNCPIEEQENKEEDFKEIVQPKINEGIYNKICSLFSEIKEIDKVVPFCIERNRNEMLLDRGLLLCQYVKQIMNSNYISFDDILNFKANNNIDIDEMLLDDEYWMSQKVDKYARTPQRQKIPKERWFMLKDKSFKDNLHKCFDLNKKKFSSTYKWLMSFNNNFS